MRKPLQFRSPLSPSFLGSLAFILMLLPGLAKPILAQQRLPHIYSSDCEINEEPEWPILCLRPQAEASFLSDTSRSNNYFSYSGWSLYGGLYLTEHISLHGTDHDGLFQGRQNNSKQRDKHERRDLYLALGNTATAKGRLILGHFDLPFGLGDNFRPRIYELRYSNRNFIDTYGDGLQLTYDNLVNARLDLAAAIKNDHQLRPEDQIRSNQYAVRGMLDFSAMHGTRLSFSYYRHEESGISKVGASAYNHVDETGESFIEWVRISTDWRRPFSNDQQIIAFGYRSIMSKNGRGLFRYEFQEGRHRIFDMGYEYSFFDIDVFSALITFEKEEVPDFRQLNTIISASARIRL